MAANRQLHNPQALVQGPVKTSTDGTGSGRIIDSSMSGGGSGKIVGGNTGATQATPKNARPKLTPAGTGTSRK